MRVAIGSDHAGFDQKASLRRHLEQLGHEVTDVGPDSDELSVDYPDFAEQVGGLVAAGEVDRGVLVCGTGIGMAMAANKIDGVRAANVLDVDFARLSREHNDANVVAVSGRFVSAEKNAQIVDAFLEAEFLGDRHTRRVEKIKALESE
ncbi:MAG: ribose 5-phosphate isomerase B [Actinobacteria bacterium]|nr:ribose 5-phosphate isomerase B [Actinomycetota bacterium]MCL5887693.1 ribose 5-phosphate isomerase B [Actinomycetota bacterium]